MRIPENAIVPMEKLTKYLLVPRHFYFKALYLAQAGFTEANPEDLLAAIRRLAVGAEGREAASNEFGTFYRVEGDIVGPNGRALAVVTVWLRWHSDGSVHLVTLTP